MAPQPSSSNHAAHDVLAVGNAIVDVITRADNAFLETHGIIKGAMNLIDAARAETLYAAMGAGQETSGGSAANTAVGVAAFGGAAAYIGKVAEDQLGRIFSHDITAQGVTFRTPRADPAVSPPTARCLIMVTDDAERSMNTYLGACVTLTEADIDRDLVEGAAVTYLEGYLWDPEAAKAAFRKAMTLAHGAGRKVSLTLSDSFCVDRHRPEFLSLVDNEVDILFANEHELISLYQAKGFDEALQALRGRVEVACLTRSAKGSVILEGDEVHVLDAHPVDAVADVTGAGDLFAAGFLYGYTSGRTAADSGRLGHLAAAEVISHVGARPLVSLRDLARAAGLGGTGSA